MPEGTTVQSELGNQEQDSKSDSVFSRKLKKVLDSKLESDKDTVDALKELSTFFQDNNLKSRRNLRGEIERRNLQINRDFLSAFSHVVDGLDKLHADVVGMSESCKSMQTKLQTSAAVTGKLMTETTEIQGQAKRLSTQKQVAEAWRERLSLRREERNTLTSDMLHQQQHRQEFFRVLAKVGRIHSDTDTLLAAGHDTAAIAVRDQMAELQEAALDRLYRWAVSTVRSTELAAEVLPSLAEGLQHLQARPGLTHLVLQELVGSRRAAITRAFIDALTVGGPGGTPRPIEMHAHDPTRYVGDMLAWIHQACPGEAETISQVLKLSDKLPSLEETSLGILCGITEGVSRPLKQRVEQILVSESDPTVLYKLTNLIRFYSSTINNVLKSPTSGLSICLAELQELSFSQFCSLLQSTVSQQLSAHSSNSQHSPGGALLEVGSVWGATSSLLSLLRAVLSSHSHSVVEDSAQDLPTILTTVADPLIKQLQAIASNIPSQDAAVFLVNNFHQLRSTLSLYHATESKLGELSKQIDSCLTSLSKEQSSHLLASLGLSHVPELLSNRDGTPLCTVPGLQPASVHSAANRLDSLLSAPDLLLLPATRLLVSSQHRRLVTQHAFTHLHSVYSQLYTAVQDPANNYDRGILTRTPDQIAELLQL